MNARTIVAVMLCTTVCLVILATIVAAIFRPPETISEAYRVKMFELLIYILGVVSGWLLGRGNGNGKPSTK